MPTADAALAPVEARADVPRAPVRRGGLFGKYTLILVSLVAFVLAVNGAVETWIMYREVTTRIGHAQSERAEAIARRISDWLSETERQVSWATRASATTLDQRASDYALLLRQVPAIADLAFVDGSGHEQLNVSRDDQVLGSGRDFAKTPRFAEALKHPVWFGPAYFLGAQPFMTLAMAHSGQNSGTTIARIDLRALAALIDPGPLGGANYAYVVEPSGRVLAASGASVASVGDDLGKLPQIAGLFGATPRADTMGTDANGRSVVASGAPVGLMGWAVVVEQPTAEALQPIGDLLVRLAWLLALGLGLAVLSGLFLARRMISPVQALRQGAAHFAANRFDHRIDVGTGDELEELAGQFNRMADELGNSYARLELKVEERTRDLAQSVRELKALEEIGRAVASSLDLDMVFAAILSRAVALAHADAGAVFAFDPARAVYRLAEAQGIPEALRQAAGEALPGAGEAVFGTALGPDGTARMAVLEALPTFPLRAATLAAGFRTVLVVPLVGPDGTLGALVLYRRSAEDRVVSRAGVMQTLANQSALAMHNAKLFHEVAQKSRELEVSNAHRTQFFANMSHELRTPLNAVLGYSELLSDGLYGTMPERALGVLERIELNGKHLLGLINDVLDLTKIEAGALTLTLSDYSMQSMVESSIAATDSLAKTKGLAFGAEIGPDLPLGRGDERRLSQVLLNFLGNAIKFTDTGSVTVGLARDGDDFRVAVRDTGPGISAANQIRIFDEFQQVDDPKLRKAAGTGLGLSIARRLLAMHGGRIELHSAPGEGSTFTMVVPVRVDEQRPVS